MGGHLVRADFGHVSSQHPVIQSVKHKQQPDVHPHVRRLVEHKVQPEEGKHHDDVPDDPQSVAQLVDEVEPLVHEPRSGAGQRLPEGLSHYQGRDAAEYQPEKDEPPVLAAQAEHERDDPQGEQGHELEKGVGKYSYIWRRVDLTTC